MSKKISHRKGFTLIELLVVVSIIGLLASIVLASLNSARAKSRDTVRYGTLVQLRTAIERYYSENGAYPVGGWSSSEPGDTSAPYSANWIPGLVTAKMISALPRDPQGGQSSICAAGQLRAFVYLSDGINYKLLSHCNIEGAFPPATSAFNDPTRPTWAVQVTSNQSVTASW